MKLNYLLIYLIFMEEGTTMAKTSSLPESPTLALPVGSAGFTGPLHVTDTISHCISLLTPMVTPLQLVTSGSVDVKCDREPGL